MARLVLAIDADLSGVKRALGELPGVARSASAAISVEARKGADAQVSASRASAKEAAKAERDKLAAAKATEQEKQRLAKSTARELAKAAADEAKAAKEAQKAKEAADKAAAASAKKSADERKKVEQDFAREVESINVRLRNAREAAEVAATRATEREAARRLRSARQNTRDIATVMGSMANAGMGFARGVMGAVGGVREQAAAHVTNLHSALIQTMVGSNGASAREVAGNTDYILGQITARRLNRDTVIAALNSAQSARNALGGNSAGERRSAIDRTLGDIETASVIDPNNVEGLTNFGALMATQVHDERTRQAMIRSAAGISFAGSVETNTVLQRGLPGLLRTISTATANAPAAQHDQVVQQVTADFLAQLQTVAASGGTVTATANRIPALRMALGNAYRANRIGAALAHRRMTDEQRAEFNQAFHRDAHGRYTMDAALASSPSAAARFFGHQFNNDAQATLNFLGTHGGGGRTQLLKDNDARLLTSYYATTDVNGQQVRQYDALNDLARQTVTPEQLDAMRGLRNSEDSKNLNDNANRHEDALSDNTNRIVELTRAFQDWSDRNPIASEAGKAGLSLLTGAGGAGMATKLLSRVAPGAVPAAETAGAATGLGVGGVLGLGAMVLGAGAVGLTGGARGRDLLGHDLGLARRLSTLVNAPGEGGREIGDWIAARMGFGGPSASAAPHAAPGDTANAKGTASNPLVVQVVGAVQTTAHPLEAAHNATAATSARQAAPQRGPHG